MQQSQLTRLVTPTRLPLDLYCVEGIAISAQEALFHSEVDMECIRQRLQMTELETLDTNRRKLLPPQRQAVEADVRDVLRSEFQAGFAHLHTDLLADYSETSLRILDEVKLLMNEEGLRLQKVFSQTSALESSRVIEMMKRRRLEESMDTDQEEGSRSDSSASVLAAILEVKELILKTDTQVTAQELLKIHANLPAVLEALNDVRDRNADLDSVQRILQEKDELGNSASKELQRVLLQVQRSFEELQGSIRQKPELDMSPVVRAIDEQRHDVDSSLSHISQAIQQSCSGDDLLALQTAVRSLEDYSTEMSSVLSYRNRLSSSLDVPIQELLHKHKIDLCESFGQLFKDNKADILASLQPIQMQINDSLCRLQDLPRHNPEVDLTPIHTVLQSHKQELRTNFDGLRQDVLRQGTEVDLEPIHEALMNHSKSFDQLRRQTITDVPESITNESIQRHFGEFQTSLLNLRQDARGEMQAIQQMHGEMARLREELPHSGPEVNLAPILEALQQHTKDIHKNDDVVSDMAVAVRQLHSEVKESFCVVRQDVLKHMEPIHEVLQTHKTDMSKSIDLLKRHSIEPLHEVLQNHRTDVNENIEQLRRQRGIADAPESVLHESIERLHGEMKGGWAALRTAVLHRKTEVESSDMSSILRALDEKDKARENDHLKLHEALAMHSSNFGVLHKSQQRHDEQMKQYVADVQELIGLDKDAPKQAAGAELRAECDVAAMSDAIQENKKAMAQMVETMELLRQDKDVAIFEALRENRMAMTIMDDTLNQFSKEIRADIARGFETDQGFAQVVLFPVQGAIDELHKKVDMVDGGVALLNRAVQEHLSKLLLAVRQIGVGVDIKAEIASLQQSVHRYGGEMHTAFVQMRSAMPEGKFMFDTASAPTASTESQSEIDTAAIVAEIHRTYKTMDSLNGRLDLLSNDRRRDLVRFTENFDGRVQVLSMPMVEAIEELHKKVDVVIQQGAGDGEVSPQGQLVSLQSSLEAHLDNLQSIFREEIAPLRTDLSSLQQLVCGQDRSLEAPQGQLAALQSCLDDRFNNAHSIFREELAPIRMDLTSLQQLAEGQDKKLEARQTLVDVTALGSAGMTAVIAEIHQNRTTMTEALGQVTKDVNAGVVAAFDELGKEMRADWSQEKYWGQVDKDWGQEPVQVASAQMPMDALQTSVGAQSIGDGNMFQKLEQITHLLSKVDSTVQEVVAPLGSQIVLLLELVQGQDSKYSAMSQDLQIVSTMSQAQSQGAAASDVAPIHSAITALRSDVAIPNLQHMFDQIGQYIRKDASRSADIERMKWQNDELLRKFDDFRQRTDAAIQKLRKEFKSQLTSLQSMEVMDLQRKRTSARSHVSLGQRDTVFYADMLPDQVSADMIDGSDADIAEIDLSHSRSPRPSNEVTRSDEGTQIKSPNLTKRHMSLAEAIQGEISQRRHKSVSSRSSSPRPRKSMEKLSQNGSDSDNEPFGATETMNSQAWDGGVIRRQYSSSRVGTGNESDNDAFGEKKSEVWDGGSF